MLNLSDRCQGLGPVRAFQVHELAGTFAGIGLALNGLATAMLVQPAFEPSVAGSFSTLTVRLPTRDLALSDHEQAWWPCAGNE